MTKAKTTLALAIVPGLKVTGMAVAADIDPACTTSLTDSGSISVFYDTTTELVNIEATLVDQSYAGWGWGASMVATEMVIFSANADSSTALTYYSTA